MLRLVASQHRDMIMGQTPFASLLNQLRNDAPSIDQEDWLRIARQQPSPSAKLRMLSELADSGFDARRFHQQAIVHLVTALRRENDRLRLQLDQDVPETLTSAS